MTTLNNNEVKVQTTKAKRSSNGIRKHKIEILEKLNLLNKAINNLYGHQKKTVRNITKAVLYPIKDLFKEDVYKLFFTRNEEELEQMNYEIIIQNNEQHFYRKENEPLLIVKKTESDIEASKNHLMGFITKYLSLKKNQKVITLLTKDKNGEEITVPVLEKYLYGLLCYDGSVSLTSKFVMKAREKLFGKNLSEKEKDIINFWKNDRNNNLQTSFYEIQKMLNSKYSNNETDKSPDEEKFDYE